MKSKKTTYLVRLSLLVAIELVLAYTPLGYLKTLGLEITFLMIPVVIGAILMGPAAGAVLGGVFGITSFLQCFSTSVFGAALLGINPLFTFIVCVPTRILAGWLTGVIFKTIYNRKPRHFISFWAASLAGPILNTALFMSCLVLFFYGSDYIQGVATNLGASNPFVFVFVFVGLQGLVEALVGCVVSAVICKGTYKYLIVE